MTEDQYEPRLDVQATTEENEAMVREGEAIAELIRTRAAAIAGQRLHPDAVAGTIAAIASAAGWYRVAPNPTAHGLMEVVRAYGQNLGLYFRRRQSKPH